MKMQKKELIIINSGVGVVVRMNENEELKFLWKCKRKPGGVGFQGRGSGWGGGVRVIQNEKLKSFCENSKTKSVRGRLWGYQVLDTFSAPVSETDSPGTIGITLSGLINTLRIIFQSWK